MVIYGVRYAGLLRGEKRFPPPYRRQVEGAVPPQGRQMRREAFVKTGEKCMQGGETCICALVGHLLRQPACQSPHLTKEEQI